MSPSDSQPSATALRLGAEIVIGAAGAVSRQEIDLAALARRDIVAVLPDDAQRAEPSPILPTEPLCASHSTPEITVRALPLGAAIEFADLFGAEPLDPFLLQPGGHRRGHVEDDLQARKVVAFAHGSSGSDQIRCIMVGTKLTH